MAMGALVEPRVMLPVLKPPLFWVAVCAISLILGFVVWPGLFGGAFIVLPFVWIWRPRREPKMDPRTNGHTSRDAGTFTGD